MARERPKRWLRFSLATLLVLITFCAVGLAWLNDRRQLQKKIEQLEANLTETQQALVNAKSSQFGSVQGFGPLPLRYESPLPTAEEWNSGRSLGRPWPSEQPSRR